MTSGANLLPRLVLAISLAACATAQDPPNLQELECAVHQYAFEYGSAKVSGNAAALHAGLNLDNCSAWLSSEQRRANAATIAAKPAGKTRFPRPALRRGAASFFVDGTSGADTNPGTEAAPFQTLARARDAARALPTTTGPRATINIRAGVYYLNETLALDARDSNVRFEAANTKKLVTLPPRRSRLTFACLPPPLLVVADGALNRGPGRQQDAPLPCSEGAVVANPTLWPLDLADDLPGFRGRDGHLERGSPGGRRLGAV